MSALSAAPAASPVQTAAQIAAQRENEGRMRKTAEDFEASFLSQMFKPMFEGLNTDTPFGGGEAENTWRSFMLDAMAKQTVKAGGIGMTNIVMAEMIKMQEKNA